MTTPPVFDESLPSTVTYGMLRVEPLSPDDAIDAMPESEDDGESRLKFVDDSSGDGSADDVCCDGLVLTSYEPLFWVERRKRPRRPETPAEGSSCGRPNCLVLEESFFLVGLRLGATSIGCLLFALSAALNKTKKG